MFSSAQERAKAQRVRRIRAEVLAVLERVRQRADEIERMLAKREGRTDDA